MIERDYIPFQSKLFIDDFAYIDTKTIKINSVTIGVGGFIVVFGTFSAILFLKNTSVNLFLILSVPFALEHKHGVTLTGYDNDGFGGVILAVYQHWIFCYTC